MCCEITFRKWHLLTGSQPLVWMSVVIPSCRSWMFVCLYMLNVWSVSFQNETHSQQDYTVFNRYWNPICSHVISIAECHALCFLCVLSHTWTVFHLSSSLDYRCLSCLLWRVTSTCNWTARATLMFSTKVSWSAVTNESSTGSQFQYSERNLEWWCYYYYYYHYIHLQTCLKSMRRSRLTLQF